MILAIDVGNTNIVLGCIEDGSIEHIVRLHTDANQTDAEDVRTSRMSAARYGKRTNGSRANGGGFQKISTICHCLLLQKFK